ncbi:MAG: hypothetical protein OHK0046_07080 [Anaerolineae bacterium]
MSTTRPANAGTGKLAIARTSGGFVNIRSGPGTNFEDIGDILNNTQVTYFPATRTSTAWVWVEQYALGGWVSTDVVTFEDVNTQTPNYPPTPYDGKIAVWHWKGQAIPEDTIAEFAANLKRNAPAVSQVWVKVGDGNAWQGRFDSGDMAVNGPADVDRWVQVLAQYGLEFHAWIVLKGVDIDGEADIMIQTCRRPGVKSLILDVEPYAGYWEAGPRPIRPLMTTVRRALGGRFHIGLSIDPRPAHYKSVFPQEWQPFVNSVHPQTYWTSFRRPVDEVVAEMYSVWGGYGKPIIPALQGVAPVEEQKQALASVVNRYGSKGVSWWRYGVISQWEGINTSIVVGDNPPSDPGDDVPPEGTVYADEKIIFVGKAGFRSGTYTGRQEFIPFTGAMGWEAYYTKTEVSSSKVWTEWSIPLEHSGYYQISVFIPTQHSTTQKARYKIHAIRGTTTEVIVDLNQQIYRNQWVPLGVFDLVKEAPNAGKVFLNDVTGEADKEIAFDAVRLRRIVKVTVDPTTPEPVRDDNVPVIIDGVYVADGYDSPVGTAEERRGDKVWPSGWRDASPYAQLYFVGTAREAYHTGADLNYGSSGNADIGQPVYATASGIVTYQADLRPWGNVTIIRHDPLKATNGPVLYSRYGHMQNVRVQVGERVRRGQLLGEIGTGGGRFVAHLHFDISQTTALERPGDWPGKDLARLKRNYVDPQMFIKSNRPKK